MAEVLAYIGGALGIIASLVTIIQFFKPLRIKYKFIIFVIVVICTTVSLRSWYQIEKKSEKNNIEKVKSDLLKKDAKITSSAILITGWENSGDYIGYLTQIVGFYGRYKETYNDEYETNKKQLEDYISFFKDKRDKNEFVYSSEWDNLKGLVTSGKDNLSKICSSTE